MTMQHKNKCVCPSTPVVSFTPKLARCPVCSLVLSCLGRCLGYEHTCPRVVVFKKQVWREKRSQTCRSTTLSEPSWKSTGHSQLATNGASLTTGMAELSFTGLKGPASCPCWKTTQHSIKEHLLFPFLHSFLPLPNPKGFKTGIQDLSLPSLLPFLVSSNTNPLWIRSSLP